jgi:hypothetical protein
MKWPPREVGMERGAGCPGWSVEPNALERNSLNDLLFLRTREPCRGEILRGMRHRARPSLPELRLGAAPEREVLQRVRDERRSERIG